MTEPPALDRELARIANELSRLGVRFALVGVLAVSIRGEVRLTRDIDLAVSVASDAETEDLVGHLRGSGYQIVAVVEHEAAGRLATVRLIAASGVRVDILPASSGIEAELVESASIVEIEGIGRIPVASTEDLIATKVLAMTEERPQDAMDARALLLASPDLDVVRQRLRLITRRGYHRDQDLAAKLDGLLQEEA